MSGISDIFITNDFINDCADASLTLKLFHARFNQPNSVQSTVNIAEYVDSWYSNPRPGSSLVTIDGSDFLATYINKDRSALIVKVPYLKGVDDQIIGYLTYRRYRGNQLVDATQSQQDKVAFVFKVQDFQVGIYRQVRTDSGTQEPNSVAPYSTDPSVISTPIESDDDNDNSYIYIDISKLNIVANLEPFYNHAIDDTQNSWTLWNYVNEHAHDLFGMTYTTISGTNEPDFNLKNKQGYFFDALDEKYSSQKMALHFSNKVTALTLPIAIHKSGNITEYVSSITSDDYRKDSLIQTTDGRIRVGNLMQTEIDGTIVDPTKAEIDNISNLKVTFDETTYPEYVKKLYVTGAHIDMSDQYLFWNDG